VSQPHIEVSEDLDIAEVVLRGVERDVEVVEVQDVVVVVVKFSAFTVTGSRLVEYRSLTVPREVPQ
jgi:hypothetical protein